MTKSDSSRPLRVLQLTDPHLMADPDGALLGVRTRDSLDAVIAQVLRDHDQPDLILATGDLAQDGSEEAYRTFGERLEAFACHSAWLAGNHDNAMVLKRIAAEYQADRRHIVQGGWQFILLDTSVPDHVHGELADSELRFLQQTLEQNPEVPALVALHHHPVDVGAGWMSDIGLRNREAFWDILGRYPQVKVVLWGHVHQDLDQTRHGIRLLATPSTCIQFTAGSREFSVEEKAPGYRWFELHSSGALETEVRRAGSFEFELDCNSSGY